MSRRWVQPTGKLKDKMTFALAVHTCSKAGVFPYNGNRQINASNLNIVGQQRFKAKEHSMLSLTLQKRYSRHLL